MLSRTLCALAVASPMLAGACGAQAACGNLPAAALAHKSAFLGASGFDGATLQAASYQQPTMVGMWKVSFVSGSQQIDFGYAQWHSDGTEFLNSGSRAPATQNYCLGVWQQTGTYGYKLNHWAISYDMNGNHNADVNIKEHVFVDKTGMTFSGKFSITAYDPNTGKRLGPPVIGDITGTRVTVD